MGSVLALLFVVANAALCVYSLHILLLTALFLMRRRSSRQPAAAEPLEWPSVTVQLPLYNEAAVVERLLAAVAALDYPVDQLEIQVLDDSTDETTELAERALALLREQGLEARLVRRPDRQGFKAGALAYGLPQARGEFIAIFDADFVPSPDFLRSTLPALLADPTLAFMQARWGHLNRDYSPITRLQSLAIDSHFIIDQQVRFWAGFPMHFNGTGGIWRRQAIETSGGWQGDTLCEDLDLSYRAQLAGWRPGYLADVTVPAELTPQLEAFKQQQFRWAKGSIQCWRKLWSPIQRSAWPWWKKLLARIHLSGYFINPLVLLLVLITPPFAASGGAALLPRALWLPTSPLWVLSLAFPLFYAVALRSEFGDRWRSVLARDLPLVLLVGTGLAFSNTLAVAQGLVLKGGRRFGRTPKFNVVRSQDRWHRHRYRLPVSPTVLGEALVGLYSLIGAALTTGPMALFSLYYGACFAFTAVLGVREGLQR